MSNLKPSILNIGAGKIKPLWLDRLETYFLVNLDPMYSPPGSLKNRSAIEEKHCLWNHSKLQTEEVFYNDSWENFLPKYLYYFDKIVIYRFLEHVPMVKVPFFIYLLSECLNVKDSVDVIVPNYEKLASRILKEDPFSPSFEAENILTTTELLNEPYDPHASIWTPKRAKYFFELEGRFELKEVIEEYEFEGRDIYMWFYAEKVK